jgi:hypothetical protein
MGQIHLGRAGKGILLFTFFAVCLDAFLLCPLILPDAVVRATLLALTVLAWLISCVDYWRQAAEGDLTRALRGAEPE